MCVVGIPCIRVVEVDCHFSFECVLSVMGIVYSLSTECCRLV
jgi:hypothetical protein